MEGLDTEGFKRWNRLGVRQLQAKDYLELAESRRCKEGFSVLNLQREQGPANSLTLDSWSPGL